MSTEFRDLGLFEANSGIVDYSLQARREARDKPVLGNDIVTVTVNITASTSLAAALICGFGTFNQCDIDWPAGTRVRLKEDRGCTGTIERAGSLVDWPSVEWDSDVGDKIMCIEYVALELIP